jgi:hypothetical protein
MAEELRPCRFVFAHRGADAPVRSLSPAVARDRLGGYWRIASEIVFAIKNGVGRSQATTGPARYVYSGSYHVDTQGFGDWTDCALGVQARVGTHPAPDRCIIDAGSKSPSSDLLGLTGFSCIVEHPDWEIYGLSEEQGHVRAALSSEATRICELVSVIPNHACVVTNPYDRIHCTRQGRVETFYEVAARGKVL